jgi:hypothetical protein
MSSDRTHIFTHEDFDRKCFFLKLFHCFDTAIPAVVVDDEQFSCFVHSSIGESSVYSRHFIRSNFVLHCPKGLKGVTITFNTSGGTNCGILTGRAFP